MVEDETSFIEFYSPVDFSCENKLEKYSRKTRDTITELIDTEAVYVDRLNRIVNHYAYLQEQNEAEKTVNIAQEEMYFKALQLRHFHINLLIEIRRAQRDPILLAKVFVKSENKFSMYLTYDKLYKNINHGNLVLKQNPFESLERHNISNYLNEPNKRLPSYLIIFTELLKFRKKFESAVEKDTAEMKQENEASQPPGDKDLTVIQQAIDIIKNALRLMKIANVVDTILDCPMNIYDQGHLLQHDKFKVTNSQKQTHSMMCSLFENVLIFSIESHQGSQHSLLYRDLIGMGDLGLCPPYKEDAVSFSVFYQKRTFKSYTLYADTSTQKKWVDEITRLLLGIASKEKDALRRMSRSHSLKETSETSRSGRRRFGLSWFPSMPLSK